MTGVPFIAIEGPIGIGKTSLAKKLSEHFNFHLLKEIVEENPFLGKFYENIDEWSFQTEMFFLCNRFKQLEDMDTYYLQQERAVIADYHILKNMIFAKRTLQQDKLDKYEKIYQILTEDIPMPNILIYITADLETILKRIRMRGREVEKNIDPEYLRQLSADYETFMMEFERTHPHIPVLRINGDQMDFVQFQDHLEQIIGDVEHLLQEHCALPSN